MTGTVTKVTVASPATVVDFKLATKQGVPVIGFGTTSKSSTATVASYPNIAFSLAKLIPAAGGTPSKWVSYIVTTVPTTTTAAAPTRPSTDNTGTLVDNKDGTYKYTFYRDIPGIKAQVDGMTVAAPNNKADLGDLTFDASLTHRMTIQISGNAPGTGTNTPTGADSGVVGVPLTNAVDVTYDFVPATGLAPAASAERLITTTSNCNACHSVLGGIPGGNPEANAAGFHGGGRNNVEYCVVCHTDQRKYGRTEAVNAGFPTLQFTGSTYRVADRAVGNLVNMIHKTHNGVIQALQNYDYAGVKFNEVGYPQDIRNCQNCHTQTTATPQGNNWQTAPSRLACGACHDGINFDTGIGITLADAAKGAPYAPSTGFNGKAHPANATDAGCTNAGCHGVENGVNKVDVAHFPVTPPAAGNALLVTGGNANTNSASIASGASVNRIPAGSIKVSYEISSVTRTTPGKNPQMVFRMLQNGARKDLNVFATATNNPATGRPELWDGFLGAPSVYFVWSVPQDGVAKPQDFNVSASSWLRNLWAGVSGAGTLTGPDANGFYTATLTQFTVPDGAVMLTGGLGYTYNVTNALPLTQTNLAEFPTAVPTAACTGASTLPSTACGGGPYASNGISPTAKEFFRTGGLIVIAPNVQKVATGYTGRRPIVDDKRCNACHQELGTFTEDAFHAGQRNDGSTCSWCHRPNQTSSAWSADSVAFVHAIHAAAKRNVPYTWHAVSTTNNFADIAYPGILSNCEQCHIPGSYDFGNTASADAVGISPTSDGIDKRLPRTVGVGYYVGAVNGTTRTISGATCATFGTSAPQTSLGIFSFSPYIVPFANAAGDAATPNSGNFFGYGFQFNATAAAQVVCPLDGSAPISVPPQGTLPASSNTLVMSPMVSACSACHDSNLAISHMRVNGGSFYETRAIAGAKTEQCLVCHASGRTADTKVVHGVK